MLINNLDQETYLTNANFGELAQFYASHPIVIYVGAGVSWANEEKFGLRGWDDLIRRVIVEDKGLKPEDVADFDQNASRYWHDKPWKMADWVSEKVGVKEFRENIEKIVRRDPNFSKTWKQLSGTYLRKAPTLNAVAAFCAQLTGSVEGTQRTKYRVAPNPRVTAIVSTNYDPYLEAASSTMFGGENLLKPVGARGSSAGSLKQIPVFHIHGYVPYPENEKSRKKNRKIVHKPMVQPVLTSDNYRRAWRRSNAFGFTMGPQIQYLRHYTTLFIGFSFRDQWVKRLLIDLNDERKPRKDRLYHYALMCSNDVEARGEELKERLGVKAIPLKQDYSNLPACLSNLYEHGLAYDSREEPVRIPVVAKKLRQKSQKPQPPKCSQQKVGNASDRGEGREVIDLTFSNYFQALFDCRT